jgi:hypothetical protein
MKNIFILLGLSLLLNCCNNFPEAENEYQSIIITYPNPAGHSFSVNVHNTSSRAYTLKVFNPSGSVTLEASIPDNQDQNFQVTNANDGHYHVVLDMGSEVVTRKVLVSAS